MMNLDFVKPQSSLTQILKFICLGLIILPRAASASLSLDVNDVSYMWPPVLSEKAAASLISLKQVMPPAIFHEIVSFAQGNKLQSQILRAPVMMPVEVTKIENWRIVSMRVDPCAPPVQIEVAGQAQCRQEVRLVAQPFFFDGVWEYYDFALHIIFDVSTGPPENSDQFRELLTQLIVLKAENKKIGIETNGVPLRIHPGFKSPSFTTQLKNIFVSHVKKYSLRKVTFIGAETEKGPWVFFQGLVLDGHYELEPDSTLRGQSSGEIRPELPGAGGSMQPLPSNHNWPYSQDRGLGPNVSDLFFHGQIDLQKPASLADSTLSQVFKLSDIVHAVENPDMSDRNNTDCFSCHSVMSRGLLLKVADKQNQFKYQAPNEHVTLTALSRNESPTNFRMFGWFGSSAIISGRVVHESARAADVTEKFLNK